MVQKRELDPQTGETHTAETTVAKKAKGDEDAEAAFALATLANAATSEIPLRMDSTPKVELSPKQSFLPPETREGSDHSPEDKSVASISNDVIDSILASGDTADDASSPAPVTPDKKNLEDLRSRRVHFAPGVKESHDSKTIQTLALPHRYAMPPPRSMARGAPRMFAHYASGGHQYSFPTSARHQEAIHSHQEYAYHQRPHMYHSYAPRSHHLHPIHHPLSPERRLEYHHAMVPPGAPTYSPMDNVAANAYQNHTHYQHPLSPMPHHHHDPARASPNAQDPSQSPTAASPAKKDDSASPLVETRASDLPTVEGPTPWVCDFCRVASFSSYEEACAHESTCQARNAAAAAAAGKPQEESVVDPRAVIQPKSPPESYSPSYAGAAVLPTLRPHAPHQHIMHPVHHEDVAWAGQREGPHHVIKPAYATDKAPWERGSITLAIPGRDKVWLPELQCLMRELCVEAFSATPEQSNLRRVSTGRVGIRCQFCAKKIDEDNGATCFPANTANIYDAVKQWQNFHLDRCTGVSLDVKGKFVTMRAAMSSNPALADTPKIRQYWTASARALGMTDTLDGIRFGRDPLSPPDLTELDTYMKSSSPRDMPLPTHGGPESRNEESQCLIAEGEDLNIPPYVFFMIRQMEKCSFTEADRFVARSKGPLGYVSQAFL